MKESMNVKDLKNSNILVALFVDDLSGLAAIEETFYSISKQTHPVDLLVLHPNFSDEQLTILKGALDNPKIILRTQNQEGVIEEEIIDSDGKINYFLSISESDSFPKIFNEIFNVALENEYEFMSVVEPNDVIGLNWYTQAITYAEENKNISIFFPIIRNTINGIFNSLIKSLHFGSNWL